MKKIAKITTFFLMLILLLSTIKCAPPPSTSCGACDHCGACACFMSTCKFTLLDVNASIPFGKPVSSLDDYKIYYTITILDNNKPKTLCSGSFDDNSVNTDGFNYWINIDCPGNMPFTIEITATLPCSTWCFLTCKTCTGSGSAHPQVGWKTKYQAGPSFENVQPLISKCVSC